MGRHTEFKQEIADEVCSEIVAGKSLNSICQRDDMPSVVTIFKWLRQQEDFAKSYAQAREAQADTLADQLHDIADNSTGDVQRDRLRVDTRKWIASKLKPKKYGDKIDATVEHSGQVGVTFTTIYETKKDEDGS